MLGYWWELYSKSSRKINQQHEMMMRCFCREKLDRSSLFACFYVIKPNNFDRVGQIQHKKLKNEVFVELYWIIAWKHIITDISTWQI